MNQLLVSHGEPGGKRSRWGHSEATRSSESGDTLIEVLLAIVVISICGIALLSGFVTSITASARHRTLANMNTILASYAETATSQIVLQQAFTGTGCGSGGDSEVTIYNSIVTPPLLPSPPSSYAISMKAVRYWNGTSFTPTCSSAVSPQLLLATATGPSGLTGTVSFVVSEYGYTPTGATPTIWMLSLASATKGAAYSPQTLVANGGTGPYTWSIVAGSLPAGLSLNATTGVISGTVSSSATTQAFIVAVTDAKGATSSNSFTISVS